MRVLHLGNVANNGYINAKLQRRIGLEADAACDERHILCQPEWEDVDIPAPADHLEPLAPSAAEAGWRRPDWCIPVYNPFARRRFKGQYWLTYRRDLLLNLPRLRALHREFRRDRALPEILGKELSFGDVVAGYTATWMHSLLLGPLTELFRRYDVVQAYATHANLTMVATPLRPYLAFEHGTMREIPFEDTPRGRLLSLAYRRAHKVIITNPDVIDAARRLQLDNYVFIPHPVDEEKYTPGDSELGARLRAEGADFVVVSPARHDWHVKGNELLLGGFAELVRHDRPRAVLVLMEWGEEIDRSRRLIRELGIDENVRWSPPLSKIRLIDAFRGADVVADQFLIGSFGAAAPEAMACGRPVVLAFDEDVHRWCFPELPPIVGARTEADIYRRLRHLAEDSEERERIGRAGRSWMERHHSWRMVTDRQTALYEEMVGGET